MKKQAEFLPYAGLMAAMLIWSFSYVWVKEAYESFSPIALIFFRLIISSALLWVLGLLLRRISPIRKGTLKYLLLISFFEPFLYFIGESHGLELVSPTTGAVIIATIPLFVTFASVLFFKEKITVVSFLGAIISFCGVICIIFSKEGALDGQMKGILLMLLAVLSVVFYTLLISKVSSHYTPLSLVTYQNTFGILFFLPFYFLMERNHIAWETVTEVSFINLLLLAVFASSIAYLFFIDGIRHIGINNANYFINLIPVFTAFYAIYKGHDTLSFYLIVGILLTVSGLFVSQLKDTFLRKAFRKVFQKKDD